MKTRIRKAATFFAFNLLFFSLYLNFVYNDNVDNRFEQDQLTQPTVAFGSTSQETAKAGDAPFNNQIK